MWEVYVEPNLKAQEELEKAAGHAANRRAPEVGRETKRGAFSPDRATTGEMNDFLDKFCGNRKYAGPRWWLGEGGVKIHDGK